jgi:hypothetical protein
LQAKLAAGATADVLVPGAPAIAKMEQAGAVVPEAAGTSRARDRVAVREGAPARTSPPRRIQAGADRGARGCIQRPAVGGSAGVILPNCGDAWGWRTNSAQGHAAEERRQVAARVAEGKATSG